MTLLLAVQAAARAVYRSVRGYGVAHSILEASLPAALAVVASLPRLGRKSRSVTTALGLITVSALLSLSGRSC